MRKNKTKVDRSFDVEHRHGQSRFGPSSVCSQFPNSIINFVPKNVIVRPADISDYKKPLPPVVPLLPDSSTVDMVKTGMLMPEPYEKKNTTTKGLLWFDDVIFPTKKGLVILCHGQATGGSYKTYFAYLGNCLAANGFLVAGIAHGQGSNTAADEIIANVVFLQEHAKKHGAFGKPLALIGQSEGGNGAIIAGQRIRDLEIAQFYSRVEAIVALAPSIKLDTSHDVKLTRHSTSALLTLQGTHDLDQPIGGESLMHHLWSLASFRCFGWIHGANHSNFLQAGTLDGATGVEKGPNFGVGKIAAQTQWLITQNYATMFLLWRLGKQAEFKDIFVGTRIVDWKANGDSAVQADINMGEIRILPRYDTAGRVLLGPLPSAVKFTGFSTISKYAPLNSLGIFSLIKDFTSGFVVTWNRKPFTPPPRIAVACDPSLLTFVAIEFEAILLAEHTLNAKLPMAITVHASLVHADGVSLFAPGLIEPSLTVDAEKRGNSLSRSMLSTVKIPIGHFGLTVAQLSKVHTFRLSFDASPPTGAIAITNFRGVLPTIGT